MSKKENNNKRDFLVDLDTDEDDIIDTDDDENPDDHFDFENASWEEINAREERREAARLSQTQQNTQINSGEKKKRKRREEVVGTQGPELDANVLPLGQPEPITQLPRNF